MGLTPRSLFFVHFRLNHSPLKTLCPFQPDSILTHLSACINFFPYFYTTYLVSLLLLTTYPPACINFFPHFLYNPPRNLFITNHIPTSLYKFPFSFFYTTLLATPLLLTTYPPACINFSLHFYTTLCTSTLYKFYRFYTLFLYNHPCNYLSLNHIHTSLYKFPFSFFIQPCRTTALYKFYRFRALFLYNPCICQIIVVPLQKFSI